jgi:hypothetical protein
LENVVRKEKGATKVIVEKLVLQESEVRKAIVVKSDQWVRKVNAVRLDQ